MFNNKEISEEKLALELDLDYIRMRKNQNIKQAKICGRLADNEISKALPLYAISPEDLLIEKERLASIVRFLSFVKSTIGSIPFQIFVEFVIFKESQSSLAEKYHCSRSGISMSIWRSRLKVYEALELLPSKKVLLQECYDSLVYSSPIIEHDKSSKIGFVFESLRSVCVDSYWRVNPKTKKKRFVCKTRCMLPEYINNPDVVCTLCKKCSRKNSPST